MRDWTVRRPARGYRPLDLTPEAPQPMAPDHIEAPWGETFHRGVDGYFRVWAEDRPLGAGAVYDRIDRFLHWWTPLWPGVCYRIVGDRIVVLWRNRDGTYRAGHVAAAGDAVDAVRLTDNVRYSSAARAGQLYWTALDDPPGRPLTPTDVAARLRGGAAGRSAR